MHHDDFDPADALDSDLIDAFVDGELSDAEGREILLRLDAVPDGWRRLALAFVEAQRWSRELRHVASGPMPVSAPSVAAPRAVSAPRRNVVRTFAGPLLATSAALLLGLAAGQSLRGPDGGRKIADRGEPRGAGIVAHDAPSVDVAKPDKESGAFPQASYQVARIGFNDPASGEVRHVEAAVSGPPEAPILRLTEPVSSLPAGLRLSLEGAAFELVTSQRVYPLRLDSGQQVMLIGRDEADVRLVPTGRPVY